AMGGRRGKDNYFDILPRRLTSGYPKASLANPDTGSKNDAAAAAPATAAAAAAAAAASTRPGAATAATSPAAPAASAAAAASGKLYSALGQVAFPVKDVERRQAHVRELFLSQNDLMARRGTPHQRSLDSRSNRSRCRCATSHR